MERGSIHLGLESFWRVIGDGTEEDRLTPVEVKGLSGIVDISAGHYKSMALDSSQIKRMNEKDMHILSFFVIFCQ